jgi:hypothetical protein
MQREGLRFSNLIQRLVDVGGSVIVCACYGRLMARPLRIEFPGALYHVTSRGDRRATIYSDDRE